MDKISSSEIELLKKPDTIIIYEILHAMHTKYWDETALFMMKESVVKKEHGIVKWKISSLQSNHSDGSKNQAEHKSVCADKTEKIDASIQWIECQINQELEKEMAQLLEPSNQMTKPADSSSMLSISKELMKEFILGARSRLTHIHETESELQKQEKKNEDQLQTPTNNLKDIANSIRDELNSSFRKIREFQESNQIKSEGVTNLQNQLRT